MKVETFFLAEFAKLFLDESSGLEIKIAVYTLGQQVLIFLCLYTICGTVRYGSTGCLVFKRGVQNWKGFCLRINMPKGNFGVVVSYQKLGIISENKVI